MAEIDDDGAYLAFDTRFQKCPDESNVLEWTVGLRRYRGDTEDDPGQLLASLIGFLAQPGYVPEGNDDWYFDVFECEVSMRCKPSAFLWTTPPL